jgi:hypothetical protein
MNDPNRGDNPAGLYAGRLEGISLPDLLWRLCERKETGVLQVERERFRKTVYVEQGRIVFAASSDPDDRLGEQLLRHGVIGLDQLKRAVEQLGRGKRLGTLLVEAGSLSPEQLVQGVIAQVKSMVLSLFTWEEGAYRFEEGPLPTDEVITLSMHTGEILFSGIRRIRSFTRIRRSVGGPGTVYGMRADWRERVDPRSLSEPEELTIEQLDKGEQSIESLCREVLLSNFEVYQTLWGLMVRGLIDERDRRGEHDDDVTDHGSLEEHGIAEVLVRLCKAEQTGVLYIRGRSIERSFHLDRGRCVFATSSNPDDGLLPYLLLRGVITLRDREETGRRLLSNKRVGTILLEMGVIDEDDLQEMVRQQLSEIIFDTFRLEQGDYAFLSGELPTNEEITLDITLESLVVKGLRRITSWARVREGCGALDQPLQLTRSFLDVLDGMDAGPEEWQVITALRSSKTPDELCDSLEVSDFRICQILWTLRVLGAIEAGEARPVEAPAEQAAVEETQRIELEIEATTAVQDEVEEPAAEIEIEATTEVQDEVEEPAAEIEIEHAASAYAIDVESGLEEPSPAETQVVLRSDVEVALREAPSEPETTDVEDDAGSGIDEPGPEVMQSTDETIPAGDPEQAEQGESIWNLEQSSQTVRLSRDEVDAALGQGEATSAHDAADVEIIAYEGVAEDPPSLTEPKESWTPPGDLEQIISSFNAKHRVVYRTVRAEVGAGAANFIRACCGPESAQAEVLSGAELQSDGSWDAESLRRAVCDNRICDPRSEYERLIAVEIETLRSHISETKVVELERQIENVDRAEA